MASQLSYGVGHTAVAKPDGPIGRAPSKLAQDHSGAPTAAQEIKDAVETARAARRRTRRPPAVAGGRPGAGGGGCEDYGYGQKNRKKAKRTHGLTSPLKPRLHTGPRFQAIFLAFFVRLCRNVPCLGTMSALTAGYAHLKPY